MATLPEGTVTFLFTDGDDPGGGAEAPMLAFEQAEADAVLDALRSTLGEAALATAEREGRGLDREAVIREALDALDALERKLSPADRPG